MKISHKCAYTVLINAILILTTISVYSNVVNFDFINYDDTWYVTANRFVQDGLTLNGVNWSLSAKLLANWHPLTWLSHMLDVSLFGMNPGAHHFSNILFHIANTLLLFYIFNLMTTEIWKSGFIAALFALHPLHVESVVWIAERKDVLCTFFLMLTLWSYIRYVKRPERSRYLGIILFYSLSLMSKPMSVTLPFILLLLDHWPLNRFGKAMLSHGIQQNQGSICKWQVQGDVNFSSKIITLVYEKTPLFVLSMSSCIITFFVQKNWGNISSLKAFSIIQRINNALASYYDYIWKMLYPFELAVFYPHPGIVRPNKMLVACIVLIAISFVAVKTIRNRSYFYVGWLWFIGTLIPVIGLVQAGSQAMADRYTYVPYIGLFIIVSWGVPECLRKWRFKNMGILILAVMILLYMMVGTWVQVQYWKNSETLFSRTLEVTSDNYLAHNNLANALIASGNLDKAIQHYQKALKIKPKYLIPQKNLENALKIKKRLNVAISEMYLLMKSSAAIEEKTSCTVEKLKKSRMKLDQAITFYKKILTHQPGYNPSNFDIKNWFRANQVLIEYERCITLKYKLLPK